MSYWVSLQADTGGEPVECYDENVTYNVAGMFALAFGVDNGIRSLHGMGARDAIPKLEAATSHMGHPDHRETYRAMNPSNGWGSHDGALETLNALLAACRRFPGTTVRVS